MLYSKYAPSLVIHFLIFLTICEHHDSKNLFLLLRTIHRTIFSHLRTNSSVVWQVHDTSMGTGGIRNKPSLVSKPYRVELPS